MVHANVEENVVNQKEKFTVRISHEIDTASATLKVSSAVGYTTHRKRPANGSQLRETAVVHSFINELIFNNNFVYRAVGLV